MARRNPFAGWLTLGSGIAVALSAVAVLSQAGLAAQQPPTSEPATPQQTMPAEVQAAPKPPERPEGVPVMYRGKEVLRIYNSMGALTPEERAALTSARLDRLVNDISFRPELATVVDRGDTSEIVIGDRVLGVITAADARVVGKTAHELAEDTLASVRAAIVETREALSFRNIVAGIITAGVATLALVGLLWLLARANARLRKRIGRWREPGAHGLEFRHVEFMSAVRTAGLMQSALRAAVVLAVLFLLSAWIESVLGALPWTTPYAAIVIDYLETPIGVLWTGLVAALPNMFFLAVISAGAYGALKVIHLFFREIERGTVSLGAFRPEWAEPTYKLVRLFIIALAFVAAFPYIPGSGSPAFQGVSVFLGLLISISSSSVISSLLAGVVLTYTGAFRLGDRIQIGETMGDVVEKTLFVTRLRTIKDVVVSIPNNTVLTSQVVNYSTMAAGRGVVLHTSVTIGYDAPWRRVHELLIEAARATEGVLDEPAPFVLQTALNDFFVTYEINGYTRTPVRMADIYSDLHTNIQEAFNRGGVEIMSPHYTSLRDGNTVTIPEAHRAPDYLAPAFRISDVDSPAGTRQAATGPRVLPAARNEG